MAKQANPAAHAWDGGPQRKATSSAPNVGDAERWVSLIGGGALALAGLSGLVRRSPLGVLPAFVGGYLVLRGATAHDVVYAALGVTTPQDGAKIPSNPLA